MTGKAICKVVRYLRINLERKLILADFQII